MCASQRLLLPTLLVLQVSACGPGPYTPSAACRRLAPLRAHPLASLGYVAKHFQAIYPDAGPGRLVPVRPSLGLPALTGRARILRIHYLQKRSTPVAGSALHGLRLYLVPPGQPCPGPRCHALVLTRWLPSRRLPAGVMHLRAEVRVPATVPPGFYDVVHQAMSWSLRTRSAVQVTATAPSPFYLVHLTDLHQGAKHNSRLSQVVSWINRLSPRPSFAIVTGDLVEWGPDPGHWEWVRRALLDLRVPTFVILGNHDYYRLSLASSGAPRGTHPEELGLRNFFRYFHPFLAYRFAFGGYRFAAVDTGSDATTKSLWQGKMATTQGLSKAQLRDISDFLESGATGHVLFGHAPPRARFGLTTKGCGPDQHGRFLLGRDRFEQLLRESWQRRRRPLIYLSGHLHWNDLYGRSSLPRCRFSPVNRHSPMMGTRPCWRPLPLFQAPLLMSTQSATKHNPLRSGGWHQANLVLGEGAGAGFGFRVLRVTGGKWASALFRFYHRTPVRRRAHPDGYLPSGSEQLDLLPRCARPPPGPATPNPVRR